MVRLMTIQHPVTPIELQREWGHVREVWLLSFPPNFRYPPLNLRNLLQSINAIRCLWYKYQQQGEINGTTISNVHWFTMKKVPMTIPLKSSMEFAGTSTVFWVPEDIAEMYMKDGLYDNARNVFMQREAFWASKRREVEKQMTLNNLQSNKSKADYPMSYFDNWYS